MNQQRPAGKSPWVFFALVFLLTIPFWVLQVLSARLLPKGIPLNLPISALAFVCPALAAAILVHRESGAAGVRELLRRAFDLRRIRARAWYLPVLLLMPLAMLVEYGVMRWTGQPLPPMQVPLWLVPVMFAVFFIAAIGEELGWQGYACDPLQERWGALGAALILGAIWALWHIPGYYQEHPVIAWVGWQCATTVLLRILIVWLSNNTGRSVFTAILFHMMINVSSFLYPNLGSNYDPRITFFILAAIVGIVVAVWGPRTLTRSSG